MDRAVSKILISSSTYSFVIMIMLCVSYIVLHQNHKLTLYSINLNKIIIKYLFLLCNVFYICFVIYKNQSSNTTMTYSDHLSILSFLVWMHCFNFMLQISFYEFQFYFCSVALWHQFLF